MCQLSCLKSRFLFKARTNLSPFTKDFRGEEQLMSLKRLIFGELDHLDRATWIIEKPLLDLGKIARLHSTHWTFLHSNGAARTHVVNGHITMNVPGLVSSRKSSYWFPLVLGWVTAWEYGIQLAFFCKKFKLFLLNGLLRELKWWSTHTILPGFEPGIFCSVGRRVIRCATGPPPRSFLFTLASISIAKRPRK